MTGAGLGPLARTIMLIIGVTAIGATTLLWQYLYAGDTTLLETVISVAPSATVGVVASYYALRG